MKKEVYRAKVVSALILIFFLSLFLFSQVQADHKPGHNPPGGGGGGGAETTTTTTGGGGGPAPIGVSIENPQDGDILKKEILTLIVKGYRGTNPESDIIVTAISDLFGEVDLVNNFEQHGSGIYGANITIKKEIKAGNYVVLVKGRRESATDERQILVTLDPTITIDTSIKNSYFKGDRIFFEGDLKYFDGSLAKNASLEIALFAPGDYFFNMTATSDQNGKFAVSYPLSFAEPEGTWDIRVTTKDKDGNEGTKILKTKVSTPEGIVFYTVNFLSPFKDAEFKRGNTVPITVEVKDEDRLLEGAKVEFKDEHAEFVSLKEIRPGIYSAEHTLHLHPHGSVWQLSVQALKTVDGITKAGGNRIKINLLPATINLILLQPTAFDFFTGQQITVKARATYADGSAVENARVTAKLGDEVITLSETEPGIYEKKHLFSAKDTAATGLGLFAEDIHANSAAAPQQAITVKSVSKPELLLRLFYYNVLARYWYLLALSFVLLALGTYPIWYPYSLSIRLKMLTEAETRIVEMQKDIQRKYFKHHSMSREAYDKLMLKYREQNSAMREKKLKILKKLHKKNKMFK